MQYGDDAGNSNYWETQWTSARLVTRDKFQFTYGRAEARIKVPQGTGMWPAFWSLGSDNATNPWPDSGEIDIFEGASWNRNSTLSNVFGGPSWDNFRSIPKWTDVGAPLGAGFHTVAVEWTPDTLQFFIDGQLHHEVTRANMGSDWRADKANYLILNVAVGGNFGGPFDANSGSDATMLVDYVRVTDNQQVQQTGPLAISRSWAANGGLAGKLGDTPRDRATTRCDLRDGGCVQAFTGGLGYWSPSSGAHPVWGEIGKKYAQLGWETSTLGYPTSDEFCGLRGGGCGQAFQGGMLYWSPATGAYAVWGEIGKKYAQLGWETSTLGYPISDEFCGLRDGGCAQRFSGGLIYWTPATGAHPVWGAIGQRYADLRWENSPLGYPTSDEFCGLRDGGCGQRFSRGYIYWTPGTGASPVWGAIGQKYADLGWETGQLGYPLGGEFCGLRDGGCAQRFQGGSIYWSPASGAHQSWGLIRDYWAQNGWETGRFGYPVWDEQCAPNGDAWECRQSYQGGVIVYNSRTGMRG
ncbi:hypothetical protein CGZ95_08600 [Enemella evansiae]|nr:hypothetical protein CGZ95_08600 [Enemella evansiae]